MRVPTFSTFILCILLLPRSFYALDLFDRKASVLRHDVALEARAVAPTTAVTLPITTTTPSPTPTATETPSPTQFPVTTTQDPKPKPKTPKKPKKPKKPKAPRCPAGQVSEPINPQAPLPPANGCGSGPTEKLVPELKFHACCNQHDDCYSKCSTVFEDCNNAFKRCMEDACGNDLACQDAAILYYAAVSSKLGQNAFNDANKKLCKCVPKPSTPVTPGPSTPVTPKTSGTSSPTSTTPTTTPTPTTTLTPTTPSVTEVTAAPTLCALGRIRKAQRDLEGLASCSGA